MRFLALLCLLAATGVADEVRLLKGAHAHNDYLHERPLLDALANGFQSIEADIWAIDGELLVAHDRDQVKPDRTLQKLYLDPLKKRVQMNGGQVYAESTLPVYLLIDFKSEADSTYQALDRVLNKYREMLTEFSNEHTTRRAVTVVISGNRPRGLMAKQATRLAGYDGRLSDLKEGMNQHFMPWISDNWNNHFAWRAEGPLSDEDQSKLKDIVTRVHAADLQVRFWAIPDTKAAWQVMRDADVDFINTDKLEQLRTFLTEPKP